MEKRNFRLNPVTKEEEVNTYWYVVTDDLLGGVSISNANQPTSQLNPYEGRFEIASFVLRPVAEHMVKLHNAWWQEEVYKTYAVNIWMGAIAEVDS